MSCLKVSFIIPLYKTPLQYLKACLDSLIKQTLQECEFIIISDGAPEEENNLCKTYVDKDTRFHFFYLNHTGVSACRNYGIDKAQGEYIAFVDADDKIDAEMADCCYAFAQKHHSDVITMDFFVTRNGIDVLQKQKPKSSDAIEILHQILKGQLFGGAPLRMIKNDFCKQNNVKFPINLGYCEDIIFCVDYLKNKPQVDYLEKAFYHYIQDNTDSITRNYTIEKFKERQKYIKILKERLPSTYNTDINIAAFNVKMEAMSHKLLSVKDYSTFEKTTLITLIKSNLSWIMKAYLLFNDITFSILKKSYKEYL